MSDEAFTLVLTVAAAALALWIMVRFTDFGPRSIIGGIVHVVVAMVMLRLVLPPALDAVGHSGLPASVYLQIFGLALPMLVYAFLSGGWVTRAAIGLLR